MSITKMRKSFSHFLRPLLLLIAAIFFVGAIMVVGMQGLQGLTGKKAAKETVAVINGKEITRQDYNDALNAKMIEKDREREQMQMSQSQSPLTDADLQLQTLLDLMKEKLKVALAEREGFDVGYWENGREHDKIVDQQVDLLRQQFNANSKTKMSDADIDKRMAGSPPPMATSIDDYRNKLSEKLTRDRVYEIVVVEKLENKIKSKVPKVDDAMLMDAITTFKIRQIVLVIGSTPAEQVERKAQELAKQIQSGADMAKLAAEFSADPSAKKNGGVVPEVSPLQDKDLKGLKAGELKVVHSQLYPAYRIIRVEEAKMRISQKDFDSKKEQLRAQVKQKLEQQAVDEFYQSEQAKSKADILDPALKGYWLIAQAQQSQDQQTRLKLAAEAIKSLNKAIADAPSNKGPYVKLSQAYMLQGKLDQAIKQMEYSLNSDNVLAEGADLRILLARMYIEKGDKTNAVKQLGEAEDVGHGDFMVRNELEQLYTQVGMPEKAAEQKKWLEDALARLQPQGSAPTTTAPKPTTEVKPVTTTGTTGTNTTAPVTPKPSETAKPKPVPVTQPKPVTMTQPKPVVGAPAPKPGQ